MKGIRREIRPYALTDFLDEPEVHQTISSNVDGMSVEIDLRGLDDTRRQALLAELAEISERLKEA